MSDEIFIENQIDIYIEQAPPTEIIQESTGPPIIIYSGGGGLASGVVIDPPIPGLNAANVQQALEELTELIPSEETFTQSDLSVLGIYPYTHNKNKLNVTVQVWDNTSQLINVDGVIPQGVNAIGVNLETYVPISGTWKIEVS
jgi:hypothetical protein